MGGLPSSVIQGSFGEPWAGPGPSARHQARDGGRLAQRAWLVAPSAVGDRFGPGGYPLPGAIRREMESLFASSFSDVRIREWSAPAFGASALTRGSAIAFAPGRFSPGSAEGRRLLGRELSHVVQQRSGRAANPFGRGLALLRDSAMEAEAERMGVRAAGLAAAGGGDFLGDRLDRAKGRMFEESLERRPPAGLSPRPGAAHLPEVVYHGTCAVIDRYPTGWGSWFTWDVDRAKAYSRSIPGSSLVYRYAVRGRDDRGLLLMRHQGEFAKPLARLMSEQSKSRVDGWIELGPGASLMLARPADYLDFDSVMGLVGWDGRGAAWSGWHASVDGIELAARGRCRFPRGRRGPGNRGAHDRMLAAEIARASLRRGTADDPGAVPFNIPWGSRR